MKKQKGKTPRWADQAVTIVDGQVVPVEKPVKKVEFREILAPQSIAQVVDKTKK